MAGSPIQLFIPDASTVVKWFISEESSAKARELKTDYVRGEINLISPRLLEYETTNALRFHPIVKLSREEMLTALTSLRRLEIMVEPPERAWIKAFELSSAEGISVYDAIYLALASTSDGKMVTADVRLSQKLSESARKNLILLRDL